MDGVPIPADSEARVLGSHRTELEETQTRAHCLNFRQAAKGAVDKNASKSRKSYPGLGGWSILML